MSAVENAVAPTPAVLRVHPDDDVAVALRPLALGEVVRVEGLTVATTAAIPQGHKLALRALAAGAPVRKYGWPIGTATADIPAGAHVHSHNLATALAGTLDYAYEAAVMPAAPLAPGPARSFMGYRRGGPGGRVGTRNEIWILCTVGCVGRAAQRIAAQAQSLVGGAVEGIHAFPHPYGCSQLGDDLDHTRAVIAALAGHPNAGGVLILGLGCESNRLDRLVAGLDGVDPSRLRTLTAQSSGDEIADGLAAVAELAERMRRDRREPCPLSDLVLGLKCGGSDGFSGLTANPLLGRVADRLAAAGGVPVLTEIPEIFGAERVLLRRAADRGVFDGIVGLVNGFKSYFLDHGQPVHENPSPGNIQGGITTLEEKSLGAVQKAGAAPVTRVLRYGETLAGSAATAGGGLALLEAPGNDAVSTTALAAAGATVLLFTTGRGTPLGCPVPTLKVATNSDLAARKPGWIDFDAGMLLTGTPADAATDALLDLVLATASGRPARNEDNDQREIALWKQGVTL